MNIVFKKANDLQKEFLTLHLEEHYRENINAGLEALVTQNVEKGYSENDVKRSVIVVVHENQPYTNVLWIDRVTLRTDNQHFNLENDGLVDVKINLLDLASIEKNTIGAKIIENNKKLLVSENAVATENVDWDYIGKINNHV